MNQRRNVALLIESSRGYGRGLLHGIADYIRVHGPWSVHLQRHHLYDKPPPWLRGWHGDGVIARVENSHTADALRRLGVPFIDLRGRIRRAYMPSILSDDAAGARLAAEHLLERGFQHYAYCGYVGTSYSDNRSRAFELVIKKAGFPCAIYQPPARLRGLGPDRTEELGLVYEEAVGRWLKGLPRPIGIMACNDVRAHQVINACRDLGIAVPDAIAVVGVDNDDVICDLCDPPLSSVVPNTRRIGFEAAALLERMMSGGAVSAGPIVVPPVGIITRRSTEVLALQDQDLAGAVRYIRDHACAGITVKDVLSKVALSSSSLERLFQKVLGRTPKAEIIRVRLDHVKRLLAEPGLPLKEIATKTGFRHPEYLCAIFRQRLGQTPGEYRASVLQGKGKRYETSAHE
jgi:LacI family transcriptional regulator